MNYRQCISGMRPGDSLRRKEWVPGYKLTITTNPEAYLVHNAETEMWEMREIYRVVGSRPGVMGDYWPPHDELNADDWEPCQ